eukprot:6491828-Amphidinium_carterae.3
MSFCVFCLKVYLWRVFYTSRTGRIGDNQDNDQYVLCRVVLSVCCCPCQNLVHVIRLVVCFHVAEHINLASAIGSLSESPPVSTHQIRSAARRHG